MRRLRARPLAVDVAPRIALVELDVADPARRHREHAALAALLDAAEYLLLDQDVVGEVVLAGLEHGAGGADGVAPALDLQAVEVRPVRHVIGRIELGADEVAGLELDEPVRTGADRLDHPHRLARPGALGRAEHVPGHEPVGGEHHGPERLRLLEHDLDGVRVELVDPRHLVVVALGAARRRRIGRELPVEHHVVGGERGAVVPLHALLQLPDHPLPVAGEAAVAQGRDVLGEHRRVRALDGRRGQRLVEDARGGEVAEATPEVRAQQRGPVPHEDAQVAAATPPRRRERHLARLGRGRAGGGEELQGGRRGEPEPDHALDEAPAREPPLANLLNEIRNPAKMHRPASDTANLPAKSRGATGPPRRLPRRG